MEADSPPLNLGLNLGLTRGLGSAVSLKLWRGTEGLVDLMEVSGVWKGCGLLDDSCGSCGSCGTCEGITHRNEVSASHGNEVSASRFQKLCM